MSHSTFWPNKTFFYPIGNTPPICLTEYVPPEQDAIILLLGCGDPRSILYTVAVDHGAPDRLMDITCCDWEPAIIGNCPDFVQQIFQFERLPARNILLLTLVADSVDSDRLLLYWSIFYDIFIDEKAVLLLREQCHTLIEAAANIHTWDASVHARFIRFATVETLNKTRDHWLSYAETLVLSDTRQKQLKRIVLAKMKEESSPRMGACMSAIPSAAPLSFSFTLSTKTYDQYWKTGTTIPNTTSSLTQLNPTFLFSMAGRQFNLHYGTDLCTSFHLGLTLTKATYDDGTFCYPRSTVHEVWDACRQQFSRWSAAFHRRLNSSDQKQSKIVIRFAYGDALAFCDGLQLCMAGDYTPAIYSSTWGGGKFLFHDRIMPTSFNVIETSNLSDHLGLLNVLIATTPLLKVTPYTTVHTSSLLSYKDHPTQRSAIEERVLLDFPTLSILLGIMPICFSSGVTFFNCSEAANLSMAVDSRRHHERVSWKFAQFTHAGWSGDLTQRSYGVHFEPDDLARKLFDVYLKMFQDEDFSSTFERLMTGNLSLICVHYHRKSFAYLLRVIRSLGFVETCWPQAIRHFINHVVTDSRLFVGANHIQNLLSELHMLGIYSEDLDLRSDVSKTIVEDFPSCQEWDVIPQIVCVVLKVPRSALRKLEIVAYNKVGNPIINCETFWDNRHNFHDSIRPIFGDIIDSDEGQKVIIEDPEGLRGSSPLIVSFFMPMWILADQRHNLHVGLCLKATPASSASFISVFGPELRIYSTRISDKENVLILPKRPDNPGELLRKPPVTVDFSSQNMTKYSMVKEGCDVFSKKLEITAPDERKLLADKVTRVDVKQITPYRMEVVIGRCHSHFLDYPIAIDGSRSKIRIARRSSYIEVDAPPCSSPLSHLRRQPFPITIATEEIRPRFSCYNAPYVNINCLPVLSLLEGSKIWICIHLKMCMSSKERILHKSKTPESWGPLLHFKVSISSIFLCHADQRQRVYNLINPAHFLPHAIIILSCIRLDTSSATILGDAVVIFPNPGNIELIDNCLSGNAAVTHIYGDELRWWNHAFPVFAERCRRWDHLPTCEYMRCQQIPLSEEYKQSPLCSCGKGKNLGPFLENTEWRSLAPHAIRIALTPIFPVPYLEDVTEPEFSRALRAGSSPSVGSEQSGAGSDTCQRCRGMGKPRLLHCSACRMTRYCSKECQIADWKNHKHFCKMRQRLKPGLDSRSQLVGLDK